MSGPAVVCPFCESQNTDLFSLFGSSALTCQYYCRDCRTVFEQVKWGAALPDGISSRRPRAARPRKTSRPRTAGRPPEAGHW